jgi:hypothetical protein
MTAFGCTCRPTRPTAARGHPTTKISAEKRPTNASRSSCGHAHPAQVARDEREDLADAETLDHRGQPEHREQDAPVLGGARSRRRPVVGPGVVVTGAGASERGREAAWQPTVARAADTKAPEGTGGRTAVVSLSAPNKSGVATLRPRPSLAGLAAVEPGSRTAPRITPRSGLAVRTCPFGQDEMYPPGRHRRQRPYPRSWAKSGRLSPSFPPMWTTCGCLLQRGCNTEATRSA